MVRYASLFLKVLGYTTPYFWIGFLRGVVKLLGLRDRGRRGGDRTNISGANGLFWWMPIQTYPQGSCLNRIIIIQTQTKEIS